MSHPAHALTPANADHPEHDDPTGGGRFEAIADAIVYRWIVERDTWIAPSELTAARDYLATTGARSRACPDGSVVLEGAPAAPLTPAQVFVAAFRAWTRRRGAVRPSLFHHLPVSSTQARTGRVHRARAPRPARVGQEDDGRAVSAGSVSRR